MCRSALVLTVPSVPSAEAGPGTGSGSPSVIPLARKLRRKMMRIMARAARRVWRFCAVQVATCDWSQPRPSLPLLKLVSTSQRLAAITTKYFRVAGRPGAAWHR